MTANLDYADEYGDGTFELQPTAMPLECNFPEGSTAYENIANVRFLFQHSIINWPNFTHCLPNCGVCGQFASDHTYLIYNLIVIGFLLPFISLCGLCGNIISAFVYSRPSLRQTYTGSIYLSALGCSDTAVIITALFLFFIDSIRRYSLNLNIIYGSLSPIVYPAGMIAQTCSVYFTLIAGIDCFVQVCMPETVKKLFSSRHFTKCTTSFILVFAFFYNIPHCFESVLLDCWHVAFQSPSVEVCPAPLRFHPTYTLIYYKYMYAIFLAVGPLLVLIALNTVIIVATVICKRGNSADNLALILVVLLFILCNTIALLINIFETVLGFHWGNPLTMSWRINYIIDISNLLVVFNSSFNFIIYYNFSGPFRCTFCRHFSSNPAYQKSPSICSRNSLTKRRAVAAATMDSSTSEIANGRRHNFSPPPLPSILSDRIEKNGFSKDHRLLLLGHSRPQHWPAKSAMAYNGDIGNQRNSANHRLIPLTPSPTFDDPQMENGQEEWEKSRLLFMDQTEDCEVEEVEEEENCGKIFDQITRQIDPLDECIWERRSDQIWQKRHTKGTNNDSLMSQRRNPAPKSKDLFETKIDGEFLVNGSSGFAKQNGEEDEQKGVKNKKNICSVIAV